MINQFPENDVKNIIKRGMHESPFLSYEVSKIFFENYLSLMYLPDIDCVFAVQSYTEPTNEYRRIEFVGFCINYLRDKQLIPGDSEKIVKKLTKIKMKRYKFETRWILEEGEF